NKTNGVTPRRWLVLCNPGLSALVSSRIGDGWRRELEQLRGLEPLAQDGGFLHELRAVKQANKQRLVEHVHDTLWINLDPNAIFDVQVKRLHEYKRQLLNALHIVALWMRARENPASVVHPRVFLFGAKAAPGYHLAKLIIRLINGIAEVVNADSGHTGIQVVFLPNYRVSLAERIIPAADVSEQISTAGKEASGTGNMKFALNGALTLGTLDGANIEIRDAVGPENFFLFGLTADQVEQTLRSGYRPAEVLARDPELRAVLELVGTGFFSPEDPELFHPLVDALVQEDRYLVLADFRAYADAQSEVARAYAGDPDGWSRRALFNVARVGRFSSDRSIHQYARDIWGISAVPVTL
ncbi:MAG: glycogen/starch/alpha-glucan phosphorylase, partial [Myxococcaceae bacterium]